jgi:hypothetical protein
MNIFNDLAAQVEKSWSEASYNLEKFPDIATSALENLKYDLSQADLNKHLAKWMLATPKLPDQINVHNTFGQPPITIFNNGKFVVDIYIWLNCDTSIHSHGFRGAFRVLHGKSLQEEFTVKTLTTIAPDVLLTDMGKPVMSLLKAGDTRTILPGKELTHRVIHLENPTVTLCVKTINESTLSQWNYFPNGLAVRKRHLDPGLIKQIYYFQYLMGQTADGALHFVQELLRKCDISTQMNLAEEIASGAYDLTPEVSELLLEQIYQPHEDEEWFAAYSGLAELAQSELHFESCNSPQDRLLGHFINSGVTLSEAAPFLSELAGHQLFMAEIQAQAVALTDNEALFEAELSAKAKLALKSVVQNSGIIPKEFDSLPQVQKIQKFFVSK